MSILFRNHRLLAISLFSTFSLLWLAFQRNNDKISHEEIVLLNTYSDIVVVTRIHGINSQRIANSSEVISTITSFLEYSGYVFICVGIGDDCEYISYVADLNLAIENANLSSQVKVIPITPWGGFVSSLNAGILKAKSMGFKKICFQSFEVHTEKSLVSSILKIFDSNTLVVGLSFEGHEFSVGMHSLKGRTSPWNTFAIWDVKYLSRTGFLLISDGVEQNDKSGGVEEVAAIAILQQLYPHLTAKLVRSPSIEWNNDFADEHRREYHHNKMTTKDSRPAIQLRALGLEGRVVHQNI